jgi:RHS repeat-associated protein
VNLVDGSGTVVASYAYDTWGNLTSSSENFGSGVTWTNPYRYDGRDGVRYDASDGLYWMQVRAYDPTVGRFISHDPLGRAPLFFSDQPYVYAGNNPLSNVDPSGQRTSGADESQIKQQAKNQAKNTAIKTQTGCDPKCRKARAINLLVTIYIHDKLVDQANGALSNLFWDAVSFGIDIGFFLAGEGAAIIGVIADSVAAIADFVEWRRYETELGNGNSQVLKEIGSVLEGLSVAANALSTFSILAFGLGDFGQLIAKGIKAVLGWVSKLVSTGRVLYDAWELLRNDGATSDSVRETLERESLSTLLAQCQDLRLSC